MKDLNLKNLLGNDKKLRKRISKELWPNSSPEAQAVQMSSLVRGNKKTIRISWVVKLCDRLGVDPNTLFGYPWRRKVIIKNKNAK